jgi:hypothetical protein
VFRRDLEVGPRGKRDVEAMHPSVARQDYLEEFAESEAPGDVVHAARHMAQPLPPAHHTIDDRLVTGDQLRNGQINAIGDLHRVRPVHGLAAIGAAGANQAGAIPVLAEHL